MDVIKILVTNSKFWTVLFMLVQGILFYFVPTFPKELWSIVDVFFGTVIGIVLGNQVIKERKEAKLLRESSEL